MSLSPIHVTVIYNNSFMETLRWLNIGFNVYQNILAFVLFVRFINGNSESFSNSVECKSGKFVWDSL